MLRRSSRLTLLIGFGVAWAPTLGGAMWPVLPVSPAREALLHLARSDVDQRPPAQPVPSSLPLTRVLFDSETVATYGSRYAHAWAVIVCGSARNQGGIRRMVATLPQPSPASSPTLTPTPAHGCL